MVVVCSIWMQTQRSLCAPTGRADSSRLGLASQPASRPGYGRSLWASSARARALLLQAARQTSKLADWQTGTSGRGIEARRPLHCELLACRLESCRAAELTGGSARLASSRLHCWLLIPFNAFQFGRLHKHPRACQLAATKAPQC